MTINHDAPAPWFFHAHFQEVSHEKQQLRFRRHWLLRPADHSVYRSQANRLYQLAVDLGFVPHLAFPCVLADPSHSCHHPPRLTVIAPVSKHCAKMHGAFFMPISPARGRHGHHRSGQCVPCLNPPQTKKSTLPHHCGKVDFSKEKAGTYLFSQVVSNQLSSARQSLTSVFGMGTGGTSASSAPAKYASSLAFTYSLLT